MACMRRSWRVFRERASTSLRRSGWRIAAWAAAVGFAALVFILVLVYDLCDRAFVQQFLTTFLGVGLAALAAIWLHRWQEARSVASSVAEARREARAWFLAITAELEENGRRLDQIEEEFPDEANGTMRVTVFYRTYTDVMETGAVRLIELLKDHRIPSQLQKLFYEYDLMNRKLDAQFGFYRAETSAGILDSRRHKLVRSIRAQVAPLRRMTDCLLDDVKEQLAQHESGH